jgi:lauroyl/myristoyl acyltransferase
MIVELAGRLLALCPQGVARGLAALIGGLVALSPKGEVIRENLRQAFPQMPARERERLVWQNARRTIELGMLALAGRFFSPARWRRVFNVSADTLAQIEALQSQPKGVLLLIPHTTLMEGLTALPIFLSKHKPVSILYRAFGSQMLERAILAGRQQQGVHLLNRKQGLYALIRALERGENAGLLFDQNSGTQGVLFDFMGRLVSATDLPDRLQARTGALPCLLVLIRTGFWSGELRLVRLLPPSEGGGSLVVQAHDWLADYLSEPAHMSDWLWAHKRWHALQSSRNRLGLGGRELLRAPSKRRNRVLIYLPEELREILTLLPFLRALRKGRPDMHLTLLTRTAYLPLIQSAGVGDFCLGLPREGFGRYLFFSRLSRERFGLMINCCRTPLSDIESTLTGTPLRLALAVAGQARPLMHGLSADRLEGGAPSVALWQSFLGQYGLREEPLWEAKALLGRAAGVGRVAIPTLREGEATADAVPYWRALMADGRWTLVGNAASTALCAQIAAGQSHISDRSGAIDIEELARLLAGASVVLGAHSDLLMLAHAQGSHLVQLGEGELPYQSPFKAFKAGADGAKVAPERVRQALNDLSRE